MRLLRMPCMARPIPKPATPTPAINAVTSMPAVPSATTRARANMSRRRMRTSNLRIGGSIALPVSQRSNSLPNQPRNDETNHHDDQCRNERAGVQDDVFDEFVLPDCQISRASGFIHGHLKLSACCQPFVKSIPGTSSILALQINSPAPVNSARRAGFRHDDFGEQRQLRLQFFPDPNGDGLARWIFQAGNVI